MDTVDTGKGAEITIRAQRDEGWADLKLEYSWAQSGKLFSVKTLSYRAGNNGRSKGNIKIGLVSKGNTGWVELTGSGVQDGNWHSFVKTLAVDGDAKSADIHFNWIYDQSFPRADINMTGMATKPYA
ncbi:hypothetical protein [Pseudomonas fluorescens]|jgi:hypothetical protein|uniref:hypothetical protein n=1 Tax=Pseudomonas fluorescens TaxID=294 RepID=UPI00278635AA|nr:hypothetical protein [Pseudomonas fluorescens]MDP9785204.1 hypothetical protein [Pseudomonas fluorescens]